MSTASVLSARTLKLLGAKALAREKSMGPCEIALRQYVSAFDGHEKDFSDVEHLFEALFHEDYIVVTKNDEKIFTRDAVKNMDSHFLSKGVMLTLIHCKPINSLGGIGFKVHVESEDVDEYVCMVGVVDDDKLATVSVVNSIPTLEKTRGGSRRRILQKIKSKQATDAEKCQANLSKEPDAPAPGVPAPTP